MSVSPRLRSGATVGDSGPFAYLGEVASHPLFVATNIESKHGHYVSYADETWAKPNGRMRYNPCRGRHCAPAPPAVAPPERRNCGLLDLTSPR